ncbi:MAG: Maf family nucleotide pyrophosphatase [Marinobacter sp.]|uniref:Maf family protein n=1 Tax=Marinobacter sp. TaxID=50741 RepID=UPI0029C23CD5|nr:Maf family protein [Marinobacter sp.]MDX5335371.1 Maf family nucleotide pyrophosphatase [Marinobacter sp.]MDX5386167.1 Maf family nucleotide pyrophosphatase [Marinobacter sp.]MDX5471677.1 Maf family nucleotide pyrophosphatase [Marinobacter sp.]
MTSPGLLLASSSPYRKRLLDQLGLPFETASPNIDESPLQGELPDALAVRLATQKAQALAPEHPGKLIIGSDQVAALPNGTLLSKPGSYERAFEQLSQSSGKSVHFLTGLAVLDTRTGALEHCCETYITHFRDLTREEISNYLRREQPYDCAGSFKMEGLGITLFRGLEGRDPNSLIGLPLIALNEILIRLGNNPLLHPEP